ncbi:cell death protein 3-like isoform X1 [Mytilus trossulus]|uniref:cell death protein 3-like isoform X1 n=1 Tax=Mytilus trossulus TaxID=6551 RepID=UPI0030052E7D
MLSAIAHLKKTRLKKMQRKKKKRYTECITNSDFDKSNMSQLFKYMGYDTAGGILTKKTKEEIKDFLKKKLNDIDNDPSLMYDSLVIMFLSGKFDSEAEKIYDCDGFIVQRSEILEIMNGCRYFKGKPKVCFVQTYNFLEESAPYDSTDSAADTILRNGTPNTDDIFVVSSYPRTGKDKLRMISYIKYKEQGPWIIGENMSGSYFIQALIYVFKKHAHDKSLIELLEEANKCLLNAVVPNKKAGTFEKIPVAQIVLLEYCAGKELFFFPGLEFKAQD